MSANPVVVLKDLKKSCGDCTVCCSGALSGEAHGHAFFKGRPCFFVTTKGCSIYEDRPESPCKSFKCGYLSENFFPEYMRPDISGALTTMRVFKYTEKVMQDDKEVEVEKFIPYMHVIDYKHTMDAATLMWFIEKYMVNSIPNLLLDIKGGIRKVGRPDFMAKLP